MVTLKEYQKLERSEICCELEGFEKFLERNNLSNALKISPTGIKANYHVGVIKYKDFQLQILPKLIAKEDDSAEGDKRILENLIFMLSYTKKLDIKTTDSVDLSKTQNPFLEVLIKEYANSLFEALKRLTPKNYIQEENNLHYLKGKIKFSENIRYNCVCKSKFYCEYDEFSENNILNQLFLFVAKCLYEISQNSANKRVLKLIIDYFADVKFVRFNKFSCEKIQLTRSQKFFEKPFKLAKMFVEKSSLDLSNNRFENISLVWDMNKLFEEFIYQVLRNTDGVNVTSQQIKRLLRDKSGSTRRDTKVDIMVDDEIVVDTKYKRFEGLSDVANADIFQVSTYCRLHDKNCALLLYPQWNENDIEEQMFLEYCLNVKNQENKCYLKFASVDLRRNLRAENELNSLKERLKKILDFSEVKTIK